MGDSKQYDEKRAESKRIYEQKLANEKEEAAYIRYQEFLNAIAVINRENSDTRFEIRPSKEEFESKHRDGNVGPLRIDFISKESGAVFTIESKFYPHGDILKIPDGATQKEQEIIRDLIFETIAHPIKAHPEYKPRIVLCYSEHASEDLILSAIKAAEKRGITVSAVFVGKSDDLLTIDKEHEKETEAVKATGKLENLPGFNGYIDRVAASEGGKKGQEILEKYRNANLTASLRR